MEIQEGDDKLLPFSFEDKINQNIEQLPCYLTYTNSKTHEVILSNLDRSPLYSGRIEGVGPRYCPSIEDKVMKFPDKERHQIFIEPEGLYTNEMYLSGMSSSLPEDVQFAMYRTMEGFENVRRAETRAQSRHSQIPLPARRPRKASMDIHRIRRRDGQCHVRSAAQTP